MAGESDLPPGLHFAGVNTRLLVRYLREHEAPGAAAAVLREAGDTRSEDELLDNATWSSYDQFRRLLEVTARHSAATPTLERAAGGGLTDGSQAEMTAMLQSLGTPSALLAMITEAGGAGLAPVIGARRRTKSVRPNGSCANGSSRASSRSPSTARGRRASTRTFRSCSACAPRSRRKRARATARPRASTASDGSPTTRPPPPTTSKHASRCLTARLEGLQQIVGELVSDDDLERVLTRIVVSAARTMSAPVVRARARSDARRPTSSCTRSASASDAAERLAAELLDRRPRRRREPPHRRSAVEPPALRPARRRQPDRPLLPAGTRRVPGVRAPGRGGARLGGRGRRSPPARPSRPGRCSSSRTRSPRSPRPTRWPRTSPAP